MRCGKKTEILLVNQLIEEAIIHGGDCGGVYFSNDIGIKKAMEEYKEKAWGKDSNVQILYDEFRFPYFAIIDKK